MLDEDMPDHRFPGGEAGAMDGMDGLDLNGAPEYDLEEQVSMGDLPTEDLRDLADDYVKNATREELESILSFLRDEDEFLR